MSAQINNQSNSCCAGLESVLSPKLFRALGDPTRLALLSALAGKSAPARVSEIATCCPIDLSVVSRHLAQMREAGVVHAEKRGREVLYSVRFTDLAQTLRQLADAIEACCPPPRKTKETDESEGSK